MNICVNQYAHTQIFITISISIWVNIFKIPGVHMILPVPLQHFRVLLRFPYAYFSKSFLRKWENRFPLSSIHLLIFSINSLFAHCYLSGHSSYLHNQLTLSQLLEAKSGVPQCSPPLPICFLRCRHLHAGRGSKWKIQKNIVTWRETVFFKKQF